MIEKSTLIEVNGLKKYFPVRQDLLRRVTGWVKAVDDVTFDIQKGETLGLVGESGCGKTTAGRTILRLSEPTAGKIYFYGRHLAANDPSSNRVDITRLKRKELKVLRKEIQIIFQDPYSSLDPRMNIGAIVGEPLRLHKIALSSEREDRITHLLKAVGLNPSHMKRYPHEFSGGQRQRIGIARALALSPQLIVADEPVSALDVSIQAQVISLLEDLQQKFGLTYLFISHDLSVVKYISNRIAVMYLGKIVEIAKTDDLFANPKHPYTETLLSAVPIPDPDNTPGIIQLKGDVPSPLNPPSGCAFHTRCRYAKDICSIESPTYRNIQPAHQVACHFADELDLHPMV